jgi:ribosomal-protein-alanine N-acetyltransferase
MIDAHAIRRAAIGDAAGIAAMSRDYIEQGLPWSWTEARVAHAIRTPDTNVVVVGEPGALIGFGIMSYLEDDAHLLLFAVRRAYQRKGVGSAILRWLEKVARNAGAHRIRVECRRDNSVARNFYGEHGYHEVVIAKGMYRGLADGINLEKHFRPAA